MDINKTGKALKIKDKVGFENWFKLTVLVGFGVGVVIVAAAMILAPATFRNTPDINLIHIIQPITVMEKVIVGIDMVIGGGGMGWDIIGNVLAKR